MLFRTILLVSLLAAAHAASAALEDVRVLKGDSQNAAVATASIERTRDGILVSGWVKRRYPNSRRIRGDIEVLLLDGDNRLLESHIATLRTHDRPAKRQRQVGFALVLPSFPEATQVVYIRPRTGGPAL